MDPSLADSHAAGEAAQTVVGQSVAIVVQPVADLGLGHEKRTALLRNPKHALFHLLVARAEAAGHHTESLVRVAIAVVVQAVAHLRLRGKGDATLRNPGQAIWDFHTTLTDPAHGDSEPVVHQSIAVIVQAVANLGSRPEERVARLRDTLDAVLDGTGTCPESTCGVPLPLVRQAVTIVVHAVTHLWTHALEGIAVLRHSVDACRLRLVAGTHTTGYVAQFLVRLSITVVIDSVAQLGDGPCHGVAEHWLSMSAVRHHLQTATGAALLVPKSVIHQTVAVVVQAVTTLSRGSEKWVADTVLPTLTA
jgi:hypothetical protein